jgi:hypothetical protein
MSDTLRTGTEFVEYSDKLSAERKKRDLIDIKIRKIVETSPPIDVCDEQRRIEHWTQVISQSNQQYDKKIMIYREQIAMYERMIENATLEKDKPDFRPRTELKKAQQDLELKKNYKPKEVQKLEIDLEVIDKKIESLKNLLGFTKVEKPVGKKTDKNQDPLPTPIPPPPPTPSSKPEKKEPMFVDIPDKKESMFVDIPPANIVLVERPEPKVIQNTKVVKYKN